MKLTRVVLRNYLSHADTDFELNGARLATIVGSNGAGKSALLEAIRFVLFDDARAKTDALVRIGQTEMSAEVDFEFAGATYRAVRGRSTRSGGKSYLELHVQAPDGSWTPLTADDIRTTQARIAELLGVDAATFATAVYLGQGEANRFADATAGERKRILGQVLGLERYARAETRTRELARTLEGRTEAERAHAERLVDAIAELEPIVGILEDRRAEAAAIAGELDQHRSARNAAEDRLREHETKLAAAAATIEAIKLVEAEISTLINRYRTVTARKAGSTQALETAQATLAGADDVAAAIAELPAAKAEVDRLEAVHAAGRELSAEMVVQERKVRELEAPYQQAVATWSAALEGQRARVTELEQAGKALKPVICENCRHPNVVDQADIRGQLRTARERLHELESGRPNRPMSIDREQAALTRLEGRLRELSAAQPPLDALSDARGRVSQLERIAARSETLDAARSMIARETEAIAAADAELEEIGTAGTTARARLEELNKVQAGFVDVERARDDAMLEVTRLRATIEGLEVRARQLDAAIAGAEGNVARLEQLRAEHVALVDLVAAAGVELARLRRLVQAFGVTGIPARIIEGVLPELGTYANELLAELRPGMTLELRAQRAKADGKGVVEALDLVVRDDVGERPLALFSGGERMSVSLAIAVALSRLVARRAGTAIRSLIVDEPDGLDVDARRAFGQALRVVAHRGELERVLLISHHPDLADFGDAVFQVTKNGSGSVVEQVA